ncbi:putative inner membrane or exported protein [Vibrio ishigakensis]|uniref:Putative inner membrane or exported protein n=1 Tax=Vibrio ishigakensis TaxID=1481914 RepID=A0A0B8PK01_9VIBR|nr:putative inner membrane or exported protein [Vibrio ishigakensis]
MRVLFLSILVLLSSSVFADSSDGIITVKSAHDVNTTVDNLEKALESKGMKVFAVIDHSAGAKSVGIDLKPTELVVFGNPKVGSPLMVCEQSVAIDLPQKALIYEDEDGEVWLSYNDPMYLKQRHQIEGCDEVLNKVSKALANFAKAATQ